MIDVMGLIARNADFRRFWIGQSVSTFGDQVTLMALPSVAILALHVSVFELGVLEAVAYAGYPIFGLYAGAWVDRVSRRRVLIAADAVRLAGVGCLPVLAWLGFLSFGALLAVSLLTGAASSFFAAAYQAYVPTVTTRAEIVDGNALLEVSNSTAQVAGPSISGLLIGAVGAVYAMAADATSYGISIISLLGIRRPEIPAATRRHSLVGDVREGLQLVWRHPLLRRLVVTTSLANLGRGLALELFLLFAYRGLHLSPEIAGLVLAAGNVGALGGSFACRRLPRRFGLGRTLLLSGMAKGLPWLLIPLALVISPVLVVMPVLVISSFFIPVWNVSSVSLRQYITDDDVLGRVAATVRTLTWTAVPLSGLLGGVLGTIATRLWGTRTGLALVLALGGILWAAATAILPISTLRRLHTADQIVERYGRVSSLRSAGAPAPGGA